jgi:hypothetical protein
MLYATVLVRPLWDETLLLLELSDARRIHNTSTQLVGDSDVLLLSSSSIFVLNIRYGDISLKKVL